MQPDSQGIFARGDDILEQEARRKMGRCLSRRTGKLVRDSIERISINASLGEAISLKFNLSCPPQLDEERAWALARLHIVAFFYWATFDPGDRMGRFWGGIFSCVMFAPRSDWGNNVLRAFADAVMSWEPRVLGATADGFFKIALRKHPIADTWSWALEWNARYRLVGLAGNEDAAEDIISRLPRLLMKTIKNDAGNFMRFRLETPLDEKDDTIFSWDDKKY